MSETVFLVALGTQHRVHLAAHSTEVPSKMFVDNNFVHGDFEKKLKNSLQFLKVFSFFFPCEVQLKWYLGK